jgi:hypothetical protein
LGRERSQAKVRNWPEAVVAVSNNYSVATTVLQCDDEPGSFDLAYESMMSNTSDDCCFLCGTMRAPISQEHVFPKWLQHRYKLWDQRLVLLNDTAIQYRNLRIPCCATCNNQALSRLEVTISSAVAAGYKACVELDARLWYLWAGKLFYGVLRKELSLPLDRAEPSNGGIISEGTLKSFSNLHLFLQGIRGMHSFLGAPPYSVLVCNVHDLGQVFDYSFRDSFPYMTLAIRMGEVGVIVAFEDAGLTNGSFGRYVAEVDGRKIHPLQFDELFAKVTYQVSLIEGGVQYLTSETGVSIPQQTEVFDGPYLRKWLQEEFSGVLRTHVARWLEIDDGDWFVSPNLVPTWMTDNEGNLLLLPLSSWQRQSGAHG